MAVQTVTKTQVLADYQGTLDAIAGWTFQWASLANGDTGTPVTIGSSDRTIQVTGTFGAGGSCTLEGSNDGTNYVALTDLGGTTIAITSAGMKVATGAVKLIRPHVTAGDGTTALTVTVFCRSQEQRF